jgi:hypothetical protein
MENMNTSPKTKSLEVGKVIICYTREQGFSYTTPENWSGKKLEVWKKRYKKDIGAAEELLWNDIAKK